MGLLAHHCVLTEYVRQRTYETKDIVASMSWKGPGPVAERGCTVRETFLKAKEQDAAPDAFWLPVLEILRQQITLSRVTGSTVCMRGAVGKLGEA